MKKYREQNEIQNAYAEGLSLFSNIGFIFLIGTFFLFVSGWLPVRIPFSQYAHLLPLRAGEFLEKTGSPRGWEWLGMLKYGDMLSFAGVVFLASISFFTYLWILTKLIKTKDYIYAVLVSVQIVIFVLAATGAVSGGH